MKFTCESASATVVQRVAAIPERTFIEREEIFATGNAGNRAAPAMPICDELFERPRGATSCRGRVVRSPRRSRSWQGIA